MLFRSQELSTKELRQQDVQNQRSRVEGVANALIARIFASLDCQTDLARLQNDTGAQMRFLQSVIRERRDEEQRVSEDIAQNKDEIAAIQTVLRARVAERLDRERRKLL